MIPDFPARWGGKICRRLTKVNSRIASDHLLLGPVEAVNVAGGTFVSLSQLVITVVLVVITYVLHRSFSFSSARPGRHIEPVGMVAVDEGEEEAFTEPSAEDR